jgi:predicted alpha/beta hydrolase family esterase
MKKRVFIIHGWTANPADNWFPWIKSELEKHDFEVTVPQMPNADFPKQEEWLAFMREIIGDVKAKSRCKSFIVINSDNDPYVPIEKGEILRDKLDAKFIILHGAGHINEGSGNFELPIVVEELLKISN